MNLKAIRRRAERWAAHDAGIPFTDPIHRRNGTNAAGRRPRVFLEQQLRPTSTGQADNDNSAHNLHLDATG